MSKEYFMKRLNVTEMNDEYYNELRDDKNRHNRNYYNEHKDRINNKMKKEMVCTCGQTIKLSSKHRHLKSIKHKMALINIQSTNIENKNENK